jgi:peptide/nickel transport system substrate-binding protein
MTQITRRGALAAAAASAALPRFAIAQADQRPVVTIAVQEIVTSNTLEMLREQSNVGTRIFRNFVEPLIDTDWTGDMSLRPGLATSWRRTDERTLEFTLREGVRFHNGQVMTAEDVAFSFGPERMWGGEGMRPLPAGVAALARRSFPGLQRVEVVDRHTVRFVNATPDVVLEGRLARTLAVIASRQGFADAGGWPEWQRRPIGTGPYRVAEFVPDRILVLDAFDEHWEGPPPARRLRFVEIPEVSSRINALLSGEVDFACDIPPDQIAGVERNARFEVVGGPINNHRILVFDRSNAVLANPLIRRALTHAIDRESIVRHLWAGRTRVPRGMQWDFYRAGGMLIEDWAVPRFDVAEARRLLREANYRGEPIAYRALNNYYTNQTPTAQILVEGWRAAGLNVQLQMVENWTQISERTPSRAIRDWSQAAVVADPVIQMSGSWGPRGSAIANGEWQNAEFGPLMDELETSTDMARRRGIWARMLQIAEREDPAYTLLHQNANFTAKRRDIRWRPAQSFVMDFRASNFALAGS